MEKTINELKFLRQLIRDFRDAFMEVFGNLRLDGVFEKFNAIEKEVVSAKEQNLISEDMSQKYLDIIKNVKDFYDNNKNYDGTFDGYYKLNGILYQLEKLNSEQLAICESRHRFLSQYFSVDWKNDGKQIEDNKKELQHIGDLMRFYENSYEQNGALESVDMFCDVVKGIKEAVKNENISEKTAKELLEPLERIRDNFFDKKIQRQEFQNFNNILQNKLNANENTSQRGALDTIIDGISALRSNKQDERNMQKTDVARTQGEADQALEKQRLSAQEKSGNGNEAQEKALREQSQKNKEQTQQQSIDPKLKEEFNYLKQEILRRYYRSKNYAELFLGERSRFLLRDTAEEFERLARSVSNIDLDKDYDKKALEEFGYQWREAMISLPIYYRELEKVDVAYDDVWDNMTQLNNIGDDFFKKLESQTKQNNIVQRPQAQPRRNPYLEPRQQKDIDPEAKKRAMDLLRPETARAKQQEPQKEQKPVLSEYEWQLKDEEDGRARIEAFRKKYDLSMEGRKRYNEEQWEQILDQELGTSDIEDKYRKDFRQGMMAHYWKDPEIRYGVRAEIPKPTPKVQTVNAEIKPVQRQPEQVQQRRDPVAEFWQQRADAQRKAQEAQKTQAPEQPRRNPYLEPRQQQPQQKALDPRNPQVPNIDGLLHGRNGKPNTTATITTERKIEVPSKTIGAREPNNKVESFKAGIEKTKQLSQQKQKDALQKYLMQKRKREWEDF